uniref:Uncharacterized protein n=1 Tax=Ignisphaera aggregans TaxID=334771 RepID=A0A7J2U062_9CREN
MPPTDLMKILSRADQLKKDFLIFLKMLGLERELYKGVLNIFPYTTSIIFDRISLYCLGMSFCIDKKFNVTSYSSNIFYFNNFVIESSRKLEFLCLGNNDDMLCKVQNAQGLINIYQKDGLKNIFIVTGDSLKLYKLSANTLDHLHNIKALTVISNMGLALTIAFDDLGKLVTVSRNYIALEHYGVYLYISSESIVQAIRRIAVEKSIIVLSNTSNRNSHVPIIEVVDTYTFSAPWFFKDNCVDMFTVNIIDEPVNTIIKVYRGFITKVGVNGIEHEYKHRMIRVALAPYASTYLKLCVAPT